MTIQSAFGLPFQDKDREVERITVRRRLECACIAGAFWLLAVLQASAVTFVVNTRADAVYADLSNGTCETGFISGVPNGVCALRAAIMRGR